MMINQSVPLKGDSKVMGYFAYFSNGEVLCEGNACVIAGTERALTDYLHQNDISDYIIKKTRFGEIMDGLTRRGVYAFDREAYARFLVLAAKNDLSGLPPLPEMVPDAKQGLSLMIVTLH